MDAERQTELCNKIKSIGYIAEPDGNGNILVAESISAMRLALNTPVDWATAPSWANSFGTDSKGKPAWFSTYGYKYLDDPWYRSFTELETWPEEHGFEVIESRPKPSDRIRARDVIVVGGGGGMDMRRLGLLGGIAMVTAMSASLLSQQVALPEPAYETDTALDPVRRPKVRCYVSPGERKARNKKLKSQKSARRYNRKG